MKAYRLTDRDSILAALEKTAGRKGAHGGRQILITEIIREDNLNNAVVVKTDHPAEGSLIFTFGDRLLKIRLDPLDEKRYSVKDVVIESIMRSSGRISAESITIVNVEFSPSVDLTSSIALYGKTSGISTACQRMKMYLHDYLNRHAFLVSESKIGFFFAADASPVLQSLEEKGDMFYVRDSLSQSVVSGEGYANPVAAMPEARRESFYTRMARDRVRSLFIYPFRDQSGNVMGYLELNSTMPDLGYAGLGNPASLKIFSNFLFEKSMELVFQMEMSMTRNWFVYSPREEIIDLSQNGRGCRITLKTSATDLRKKLKKGCTIRFDMSLNGAPHKFYGTVRTVQETQDRDLVGLRIQTGSQPDSIETLSALAAALNPGLA